MSTNETCFVIMPYDTKRDVDGNEIDFNEIYEYVIRPAVALVPGLECVRCDDIDRPGWIHSRMIENIFDASVALVDTSTLNANVFYELGVRHALRKSVTVLIRRKGTTSPFNIEGLQSIEYTTNPAGVAAAKEKIRDAITSALRESSGIDSLVYHVLPDLQVRRGAARAPRPISGVQQFPFALSANTETRVALITGDREDIDVADIWVNSENTEMQMDRFYGASTSATIRYLGARRNAAGAVVEDTIADELRRKMSEGGWIEVAPATVLVTGPGALAQTNRVKWIFHVASVKGEPRQGYRPVASLERCVTNALREAASDTYRANGVSSILFPIFGTGPGGGHLQTHFERCVSAAVEYLGTHPDNPIRSVYFYVWSDVDLEICRASLRQHSGVQAIA